MIFFASIGLLVVAVILMYVVAFIHGRHANFWPPRIEGRLKADNVPPNAASLGMQLNKYGNRITSSDDRTTIKSFGLSWPITGIYEHAFLEAIPQVFFYVGHGADNRSGQLAGLRACGSSAAPLDGNRLRGGNER